MRGGAGVVKSIAIFKLSKSLALSAIALLARRLTLLALALETFKSLLLSKIIRLFILY